MKWKILHESKGRMRLHLNKPRMSLAEADQLQDYLAALPGVRTAAGQAGQIVLQLVRLGQRHARLAEMQADAPAALMQNIPFHNYSPGK